MTSQSAESQPLLPSSPSSPRSSRTMVSLPVLARAGSLLIATGMILGAFGTHAMRGKLSADKIHAWDVASSYAIYNGLGLLLVSLHPQLSLHRFAGPAIFSGTLLFSGTILLNVLYPRTRMLGPVTPVGGMILIAGWISLVF